MYKTVLLLFLTTSWCLSIEGHRTVSSHLDGSDLSRFQKVFIDAFSSNDLQSIYYASLNIEPSQASERNELCKKIITLNEESKLNEFEKDFYLVGAHKQLRCSEKLPEAVLNRIYNAFKGDITTSNEAYYRLASFKLLNVQLDETVKAKIVKLLQDVLRKEESLMSVAYALNIAPYIGESGRFVAQKIEDAIAYADEVDGKLLQFEGGLSITALVINGVFQLAKEYNKATHVNEEKAVKFASYFLSRRSVQTAKGVHVLIESLKTLANAEKIAPVCVQILGTGQILIQDPSINIAVVDLLGKALTPLPQNIVAKIQAKNDKLVIAEKLQFTPKSSDKTIFAGDLKNTKLIKGFYTIEINVDDVYDQKLELKILGRLKVQSVDISIADSDGTTGASKHSASYPKTMDETLAIDNTQKLNLRILLGDEDTNKVLTVHQAFVRLRNKQTDQEIIFIAEQDTSKAYKFEVDIGARSADFAYKSGDYELYLIIGDASISNSFEWFVANVQLKFNNEPKDGGKKQVSRQPLPEIAHQFRTPEKRPARIVSDVFTGLCITPLVLLFIFWSKLGINVSNFHFAPSTLGFHLGFGGILTLFGVFWWQLNMFQTLRLLLPIAVFTFICGNRLLRRIYAERVSSSKSTNTSS